MKFERRELLGSCISLISLTMLDWKLFAQASRPRERVHPPEPAERPDWPRVPAETAHTGRQLLAKNQEEFGACLQRLSQSVARLGEDLRRTPLSEFLPADIDKRTEAIEHLAKQLRRLTKG